MSTVNDLIKTLQNTSIYHNQSKYSIDKSLKDKYKLKSVKKSDYIKELDDIKIKNKSEVLINNDIKIIENKVSINNDILYNLLLQSENIKELCLINKDAVNICNDNHFWQDKLKNEGYLLYNSDYKILYSNFMKAKKHVDDIFHMNKIEKSRSTLQTNGHIDINNINYFKNLKEFYKKVPFIRLNKQYDDYTMNRISFIWENDKYKCEIVIKKQDDIFVYGNDRPTFNINYPISKLKLLFTHFIYLILYENHDDDYLECINADTETPFLFYKDFNINDYKYLTKRKYFSYNIFYARRGIWEGLNL
jgi:hypothetical protein